MSEQLHIIPQLTVMDQTNPWQDDVLERKKFSSFLTNIVAQEVEPFVVMLNGSWGCGKTFFLQRWQQELVNNGWKALYFNAWQDDFIEDPLVALIGQLYKYLSEVSGFAISKDTIKEIGLATKNIAEDVTKHQTGIDINKLLKHTRYSLMHTLEEYQDYQENKKQLIQRIAKSVQSVISCQGDGNIRPIVFIVDELDRCKPDFAIRLLERIKHLMYIPGVVFVVGVDKVQLSKTICSIYGEIDTENYLRRFFDIEFSLPEPSVDNFIRAKRIQYRLDSVLSECECKDECNSQIGGFVQLFGCLSKMHKLTLREIESAYKMFMVYLRGCVAGHYVLVNVVTIMIFLRIRNVTMYENIRCHLAKPKEILDYLFVENFDIDDSWAEKKLMFGAYFVCGQQLKQNEEWNNLKKLAISTGEYIGEQDFIPNILLSAGDRVGRSMVQSVIQEEEERWVSFWNGHQVVDQVCAVLEYCDYSAVKN